MNRVLILVSLFTMLGAGVHASPARPSATVVASRPISLNTATSRELRRLPGVGELLAQRIIAARPYKAIATLKGLPGMSPSAYARIAPLVTL